ncbi:M48 family metallopeptidase [Sinisalibacter aestuarii]|uniref:Metalloendopeptidase n=1 Tax=Sinisalibacter aestuarii TaxID=2949426 RepID=A0ABQ5LW87_9RHOB|nr:M48 family metallopeptidase [Sinisalibacter aestuarii]GKY88526.1 metalloendopeptidase [Sinisalibacter aestuarii]
MTGTPVTYSAFADFLDGETARVERVEVVLAPDRLSIHRPGGGRIDWLADELRALPDQADRRSLVLTRAGDQLARLVVTDEAIVALLRRNAGHLGKRPPVENKGRILGWGLGAVASVALIIFVLVPVMANQLAAYLPPSGEKALGDATYERIRMALSSDMVPVDTCEGPEGLAALASMEARLGAGPDLPYPVTISVLDHDLVNAFAMPGGRIVIFRGLLDEADSAEEVAAVLAHELGHVVGRDPTRDALRLAGSVGVLGLLFGDFAGGTVVLLLANQLINAQYSQSAEAGADDYAHALLTEAGLPPSALGTFFERLLEEHGDAEGLAAHFASHPQMAARIEAALAAQGAAETAGRIGAPVLNAAEWRALRGICGGSAAEDAPESGMGVDRGFERPKPGRPKKDGSIGG